MTDPIDSVLQVEAEASRRGQEEGFQRGVQDGFAEGFSFGVHRGFALGRDIGRMRGIVHMLRTKVPRQDLSARIVAHMDKIEEDVAQLSLSDATDDRLLDLYNDLRQRFRALLASIGCIRLFDPPGTEQPSMSF